MPNTQNAGVDSMNSPNRQLKADINTANGGIGISYSNVVLAGGVNPREGSDNFASSYKRNYADGQQNQAQLPSLYKKGLEFNAKQKYDYNILNGQSLGNSVKQLSSRHSNQPQVLQQAASSMFAT